MVGASSSCLRAEHRLLVFCLFLFPNSAFGAADACSDVATFDLPGPHVTHEAAIEGGERHCFRLPADPNARLAVVVPQRGNVDVRFELPDGSIIDSPLHYYGDELWFSSENRNQEIVVVRSLAPRGVIESYSLFTEALKRSEAAVADRYNETMNDLRTSSNMAVIGEDLASIAKEWREQGRTQWAAVSSHGAGFLRWRSGDMAGALTTLEAAGDGYETAGDRMNFALLLNHRAMLMSDLGNFDKANALLVDALGIQRQLDHKQGVAVTLNNQGLLHHYRGDLDQASEKYLQAAAITEELGLSHLRLIQLNNLGGIHFVRGEGVAALDIFREVVRLGVELGMIETQIAGLGNLGLVQANSGSYTDALATYMKLLDICRIDNDTPCVARTLHRIGQVYLGLGDPLRGIDYLEQARDRRRSLDDRRGLAQTLRHLANGYLKLQNHEQARAAVEEGLALNPVPGDAGKLMITRGKILLAEREFREAHRVFMEAVEYLETGEERPLAALARIHMAEAAVHNGDDINLDTLRSLQPLLHEAGNPDSEIHLRYVRALAMRARGLFADALDEIDTAQTLIDSTRGAILLSELGAGYTSARSRVLDLRVTLLMDMHAHEPTRDYAVRALMASEKAKANTLLETLRKQDVQPGGVKSELADQRRQLQWQINFRASRLAGSGAIANDDKLAEWRARLDVVDAELASATAVYDALVGEVNESRLDAIRANLDTTSALVVYHLGTQESFAWVVTAGGVRHVQQLPGEAEIEIRVRTLRELVEQRSVPSGQRNHAANMLAAVILHPIQDVLSRYQRWFIVSDGVLHTTPFSVLPDAEGKLFVSRHVIGMLPSMRVALRLASRKRERQDPRMLVLVNDPVYDASDRRLATERPDLAEKMTTVGRLSATRRESDAIMALFADERVEDFTGFAARADVLQQPALANADIVHFAAHGIFDGTAPAMSGLLLSRFDPQGQPKNGFVGLRDIYALDWKAALVVLSGCETALGRQIKGEGVIGMTGGFLAAGAAQTVSSLWRIPDSATAVFMKHFYSALEHFDAASALREAQLAMQQDRRWRHPYFWSGFVAHGLAPPSERIVQLAAVRD